jgi:hypothetical protein
MRIFSRKLLAPAVVALLALPYGGLGAAEMSPEAAYKASTNAMMAQDFAGAIPDLEYAAQHGIFLAQYYLARIYAVDGQPYTNHRAAFELLRAMVRANGSVDPYLSKRAPFIADAERMLALYYRRGIPGAVPADLEMARAHLEHAGLRLGDTEAQYQLAVMDLQDSELQPRALDALDMLARTKHHAPAAAQIAAFYMQTHTGEAVPSIALGYADLAVKLASEADRGWIGDIFQKLYCLADRDVRADASVFAKQLEHSAFDTTDGDGQPPELGHNSHGQIDGMLDLGGLGNDRVCRNGEKVPLAPAVAGVPGAETDQPMVIAKGFSSAVGFIKPPTGASLRDLETPSVGDAQGEPLGGIDDPPSQ